MEFDINTWIVGAFLLLYEELNESKMTLMYLLAEEDSKSVEALMESIEPNRKLLTAMAGALFKKAWGGAKLEKEDLEGFSEQVTETQDFSAMYHGN